MRRLLSILTTTLLISACAKVPQGKSDDTDLASFQAEHPDSKLFGFNRNRSLSSDPTQIYGPNHNQAIPLNTESGHTVRASHSDGADAAYNTFGYDPLYWFYRLAHWANGRRPEITSVARIAFGSKYMWVADNWNIIYGSYNPSFYSNPYCTEWTIRFSTLAPVRLLRGPASEYSEWHRLTSDGSQLLLQAKTQGFFEEGEAYFGLYQPRGATKSLRISASAISCETAQTADLVAAPETDLTTDVNTLNQMTYKEIPMATNSNNTLNVRFINFAPQSSSGNQYCAYNGYHYPIGATILMSCNTCNCTSTGFLCTLIACPQ